MSSKIEVGYSDQSQQVILFLQGTVEGKPFLARVDLSEDQAVNVVEGIHTSLIEMKRKNDERNGANPN